MRLPRITLVALGLASAFALPSVLPAQEQDAPDPVAGEAVYNHWCEPCHGDNPAYAGTFALQTKYNGERPAVLDQRTDLPPVLVQFFVRNGVAWMPPFRPTEISDAQLADLAAYLSPEEARRRTGAE